MNDTWLVYAHVVPKEISNYDHDKYYIGVTSLSLDCRFKNGLGYEYCTLFWKAIQKYGWNNIIHFVFIDNLCREDAMKMEKILIDQYKSNNPMYGYNLTTGGEGVSGYHHTEEQKRQTSLRQKGRIPHNKGKKTSEETKTKLRKAWKKRKLKGGQLGTKKPVIVYPSQKRYDSLKDACSDLGLNYKSALNVANGHRNSIFGYTFKYIGGYINSANNKEEIENGCEICEET